MKILLLLPLLLGLSVPTIANNSQYSELNTGKGTENNPFNNFIMEEEGDRPAIPEFSSSPDKKKRRKFKEETLNENYNILNKFPIRLDLNMEEQQPTITEAVKVVSVSFIYIN